MSHDSPKRDDEPAPSLPSFGEYFVVAFTSKFPYISAHLHPRQIVNAANAYLFRFDKRLSQPFVHSCINEVAARIASTNAVEEQVAHRIIRKCVRDASRAYFAAGWNDVTPFVDANLPLLLDLVQHNARFTLQHQKAPVPLVQPPHPTPVNSQPPKKHIPPHPTHGRGNPRKVARPNLGDVQHTTIVELDSTQLYAMLKHQAHPLAKRTTIVVFVYADYCSLCKRVRPLFERAAVQEQIMERRLSEQSATNPSNGKSKHQPERDSSVVLYVKLNGPQHPEFRQQFAVKAYPAILRFDPPSKSLPPSKNPSRTSQSPTPSAFDREMNLNNVNKSIHFPKKIRPSVQRILWFAHGQNLSQMSPTGSSPNMLKMTKSPSTTFLVDGEVEQHEHEGDGDSASDSNTSSEQSDNDVDNDDDVGDEVKEENDDRSSSSGSGGGSGSSSAIKMPPPKQLSPRSQQWVPILKSQGIDELEKLTNERSEIVHRKIDHAIQCNATSCNISPGRALPARKITKKVAQDIEDVNNFPPLCVLLGGGMGAGKTTIVNLIGSTPFWKAHGDSVVNVEADEFKMSDPLFQFLLGVTPNAASFVHRDSLDAAEQLFVQAVNNRRDIVLDGTLTWHEYARQTIEMLRDTQYTYRRGRGFVKDGGPDGANIEEYWVRDELRDMPVAPYRVEIVGVTADADISVMRGIVRRITSGRDVSVRHQLNSHRLFSLNFERYIDLADATYLFDTTLPSVQEEEEKKQDYVGQLIAFKPGLLFKTPTDLSPKQSRSESNDGGPSRDKSDSQRTDSDVNVTDKNTESGFIIRLKQAYERFLKKKSLNISACSATELYEELKEEDS